MKHISIAGVMAIILGLTAASGYLHGRLTQRWGPSPDVAAAAALLETTPVEFGDWREASRAEFSKTVRNTLQCAGYINRVFVNTKTGETVQVSLIIGPPGPTSVHTPEICMSTRDNVQSGDTVIQSIQTGDRTDDFNTVTFVNTGLLGEVTKVWYAYGVGDGWQAPKDARLKYAGKPYLYKIQLAWPMPAGLETEKEDGCAKFLKQFLPVLQSHLTPPMASS